VLWVADDGGVKTNDLKLIALVLLCGVVVAAVIGWRATPHPHPWKPKTNCGPNHSYGRCPYTGG
jgi:hypothetical protein